MGLQARQVSVIATPAKVDVIYNIKREAEQGVQLYYTRLTAAGHCSPRGWSAQQLGTNAKHQPLQSSGCQFLYQIQAVPSRTPCAERHGLGAAQAALLLCCAAKLCNMTSDQKVVIAKHAALESARGLVS